jgi:uncharacterized membrane protein
LFVHTIRFWGWFSPIHLLIPLTFVTGTLAARRGAIPTHASAM